MSNDQETAPVTASNGEATNPEEETAQAPETPVDAEVATVTETPAESAPEVPPEVEPVAEAPVPTETPAETEEPLSIDDLPDDLRVRPRG